MFKWFIVKCMFLNLIINVFKYGVVLVEIDIVLDDNVLVLVVCDYGKGVCQEDIFLLLQLFFRGEKVCILSGSGLGLVIVKCIVDMYYGEMVLDNYFYGGLWVSICFLFIGQLVQLEMLFVGVCQFSLGIVLVLVLGCGW